VSDEGFVSDSELLTRLNVSKKVGMPALRVLDRRPDFPKKDPLFGGKRFYPAVLAWFFARYGVKTDKPPVPTDWEEDFS
jgi:hypothetical protein